MDIRKLRLLDMLLTTVYINATPSTACIAVPKMCRQLHLGVDISLDYSSQQYILEQYSTAQSSAHGNPSLLNIDSST
jgi:hypothetical protein